MSAPVPHTCPLIDKVMRQIDIIATAFDRAGLDNLIDRRGELEEIRKANSALRQWGEEQEDRANILEEERDSLQKKLDLLKWELSLAKESCQALQAELDGVK